MNTSHPLFSRLVANRTAHTNNRGCWPWKRRLNRNGYGIIDVYVPGLRKQVPLKPHILSWVLNHAGVELATVDDVYLAYKELTISGLQVDHKCRNRFCFNPGEDHLEVVTHLVNYARRDEFHRNARLQSAT